LCTLLLVLLFACSAYGQDETLEQTFVRAQQASRQNNYAEAERLYRQILTADSSILAAHVNLGLACYWQHKPLEAVRELETALRTSPREFSALLFAGLAYIDLTQYDRARVLLDRARQVNDQDALLLWALGSLAMMHNDAVTAAPLLEGCTKLDPGNARCRWLLGSAYAILAYRNKANPSLSNEYAASLDATLKWMEEHAPGTALLHVFKGDVFAARQVTEAALEEYRQALAIDPAWLDIHLLIGSLLGLAGRLDESQAELKMQLQQHPGDTRAIVELGSVYCRVTKYKDAVPLFEQALTADSANYEANYRLGQAYLALNQPATAIRFLERATQLNPERSSPYYLLHRAYRALNKPEKAADAIAAFRRLKADGS
jgi:tetratricopeptide (TPR) repeat protein